jgi:putative hydrolase of the HAD superfamily
LKLVFDFAGVLFHWQPLRLLQRALPHRAADEAGARALAAAIFQGYGGDWAEFDRGTVAADELVQRIAARSGLPAQDVRTVVDAVPGELQPVPEMLALLERLHGRGRPLYYLSNMPEPYARHLERAHPVVGWFAGGVISARVHHIKPEPAIFELAAQRFGAAPAELLFIDDIAANVEAAQRAGWQALQFVDPAQCADALAARGLL